MKLYGKYFQLSLVISIFLLWQSFLAFLYPSINQLFFLAIILLTLILAWKKLAYGAYIVLGELFLTSHGHLFYWPILGQEIPLRMALFALLFLIWLVKMFNQENRGYLLEKIKENRPVVLSYLCLLIILLWGLGWGIVRNNFSDAFNDFNGYLYLLLLPVFISSFKDIKQKLEDVLQVFLGTLSAMVFFNLIQLFFFTHKISDELLWPLYRWTRISYLGEITYAGHGFYRIFWPGQFFLIVSFFILALLAVYGFKNRKQTIANIVLASLFLSSVVISFSRSFWLAMAIAALLPLVLLIKQKLFWRGFAVCLLTIVLSVSFIYATVKLPVPPTIGNFSTEMLKDRAGSFVSSRWNLLPVLSKALVYHPVIGSGFGSSLTYKTEDPRLLEFYPDGNYTTYAFEWGYLELIFKIGLAGLAIYLAFIWQVFKKIKTKFLASTHEEKYIIFALIAGLLALLITHNFSPYLNHPIGIGYILLIISLL